MGIKSKFQLGQVAILVMVLAAGCERLNLQPEAVDSPFKLSGNLDGMAIDWNPESSALQLTWNDSTSSCVVQIPLASGDIELGFQWRVPSDESMQTVLLEHLVQGVWPLQEHSTSMNAWGVLEVDDVENALVYWNGIAMGSGDMELEVNFSEPAVLRIEEADCGAWVEYHWFAPMECQMDWAGEMFEVDFEEVEDGIELSAPWEGAWEWTVNGEAPMLNDGVLVLPASNDDYVVTLRPATVELPFGDFQLVRLFAGNEDAACTESDAHCDFDLEHGAYLEVSATFVDGTSFVSRNDCAAGSAGSFEAFAVESMDATQTTMPARMVTFSCDLELEHEGDVLQLSIPDGVIAFPTGE